MFALGVSRATPSSFVIAISRSTLRRSQQTNMSRQEYDAAPTRVEVEMEDESLAGQAEWSAVSLQPTDDAAVNTADDETSSSQGDTMPLASPPTATPPTRAGVLWRGVTLPIHFVVIGLVETLTSSILYAALQRSYTVEGNVYASSCAMVAAPRILKLAFALISDSCYLRGYRRRWWAAIGWLVCAAPLAVLAILINHPPGESDVALLVGLLTISSAGMALAEAAGDGLMVQVIQQDAFPVKVLLIMLGMRIAGALMGTLIVGEVSLPVYHTVCVTALWACVGATLWLIGCSAETRHRSSDCCQLLRARAVGAFEMLCNSRFVGLVVYAAVAPIFTSSFASVDVMVRRWWAGVENVQYQMALLTTMCFYIGGLFVMAHRVAFISPASSWRSFAAYMVIGTATMGAAVRILTASDIVRNQYLYLVQDAMAGIPPAVVAVLTAIVGCQVAPRGHEATVYGLATTAHTAGLLVGRAVGNLLYAGLPVVLTGDESTYGAFTVIDNYSTDSDTFRVTVIKAQLFAFMATASSVFLLLLVPASLTQAMVMHDGTAPRSIITGIATVIIFTLLVIAALAMSVTTTVFPTLACSRALGGAGCA